MTRILNIGAGIALVLFGGLLLAYNTVGLVFRLELPAFWRLWPLALGCLALWFMLPPIISPKHRSLGALFIPGLPILALCGVALMANFFPPARVWTMFWPLFIIALGIGLALAGLYLRVIWMLIPALILLFMGAAFQFSAFTGAWRAWSVLWVTIPLAVGLALLIISLVRRSFGLFIASTFIGGTAMAIALSLTALLTNRWSAVGLVGGLGLIVAGVILAGSSLLRGRNTPAPVFVQPSEGTRQDAAI
jgi:hypothetical protein